MYDVSVVKATVVNFTSSIIVSNVYSQPGPARPVCTVQRGVSIDYEHCAVD